MTEQLPRTGQHSTVENSYDRLTGEKHPFRAGTAAERCGGAFSRQELWTLIVFQALAAPVLSPQLSVEQLSVLLLLCATGDQHWRQAGVDRLRLWARRLCQQPKETSSGQFTTNINGSGDRSKDDRHGRDLPLRRSCERRSATADGVLAFPMPKCWCRALMKWKFWMDDGEMGKLPPAIA